MADHDDQSLPDLLDQVIKQAEVAKAALADEFEKGVRDAVSDMSFHAARAWNLVTHW